MAASLDPDGKNGGPILQSIVTNRSAFYGRLTYTTMPEQLQARGISWKVYSSPDETILGGILSDNALSYFKNFQDPSSVLHQNAFGPQFPVDFLSDVASGNLPQVSWLIGSVVTSDHPPSPSIFGENILSLIVGALTANPTLWAKTVLLVNFDENGGFFDQHSAGYGASQYARRICDGARGAGSYGSRQSSDYRSDWLGLSRSHADHLAVQSGRLGILWPV
jgi:phospholipase C